MGDLPVPAPFGGAGVAASDPEQDGVPQEPGSVVVGDLDEMPDPEVG